MGLLMFKMTSVCKIQLLFHVLKLEISVSISSHEIKFMALSICLIMSSRVVDRVLKNNVLYFSAHGNKLALLIQRFPYRTLKHSCLFCEKCARHLSWWYHMNLLDQRIDKPFCSLKKFQIYGKHMFF